MNDVFAIHDENETLLFGTYHASGNVVLSINEAWPPVVLTPEHQVELVEFLKGED